MCVIFGTNQAEVNGRSRSDNAASSSVTWTRCCTKALRLAAMGSLLGATTLVVGCAPMSEPKVTSSTELYETTNRQGLTLDQLRNASYQGIYDAPVKLTDGKYEGPPFQTGGASRSRVILVDELVARGDLDGDGRDEAVVLLAENSGASGTRNYLAVVAGRNGKPVNVATQLLGDRVQLRALRMENGRLVADTVAHGPAEALCCPTQKVRRTFMLDRNQLTETRREEMGTISVSDLQGVTWVLEEISFGEPVKTEPAITFRIDKAQIIGSAGCNSYFAAYSSDGPGQLKVSPPGATRKACAPAIMEQETLYLNALQAVTSYSFFAANLALTYLHDGALRTLLLAPRVP